MREVEDNDFLIDKEHQEFTNKRKVKKYRKKMLKMELDSTANTCMQQTMSESDEEITNNNVELVMQSSISSKSITEDNLARQNTQHRSANKTQQTERSLNSKFPGKGGLQLIFNHWKNEENIPETPDINQGLKLFERFHH